MRSRIVIIPITLGYELSLRIHDSVLNSARYYLKERRNAHGKVKPLKTLKNKRIDRNSASSDRESRMAEDKVNQILRDHNDRILRKDRDPTR